MVKVIGTDSNGLPVEVYIDITKGVKIQEIPENVNWSLYTEDVNINSEITEFVGGRKKH